MVEDSILSLSMSAILQTQLSMQFTLTLLFELLYNFITICTNHSLTLNTILICFYACSWKHPHVTAHYKPVIYAEVYSLSPIALTFLTDLLHLVQRKSLRLFLHLICV